MKRYDEIPHTADYAAKIYGKSVNELFENAAYAMFDMMAGLENVRSDETVNISVKAPDTESLLISWLNELLYMMYSKQILFSKFNVANINDNSLTAEAKGEKLKEDPGRIHTEIKAATYHDIKIEKTRSGYEVTVVFDV